jgi:hypothetical protein
MYFTWELFLHVAEVHMYLEIHENGFIYPLDLQTAIRAKLVTYRGY